jgi:hypothetical protein
MSTELSRLTELAKADKTTRFLSIAHHLTPTALMAAFEGLRKDASAGVDANPRPVSTRVLDRAPRPRAAHIPTSRIIMDKGKEPTPTRHWTSAPRLRHPNSAHAPRDKSGGNPSEKPGSLPREYRQPPAENARQTVQKPCTARSDDDSPRKP